MGESGDIFVSGALLGGGGKEVRSRGGIIKREVGVNYCGGGGERGGSIFELMYDMYVNYVLTLVVPPHCFLTSSLM